MGYGNLVVSSSPHIRSEETVQRIMIDVIIALLPATAASVYFFGMRALAITLTGIIAAVAAEAAIQKIRNKPVTINDGSAVITGLLLALTLSPAMPLWMVAVGAVVAIGIGKQVYGGLGSNPFNPALVGRAFLVVTFPVHMTTWVSPVDGVTSATPLGLLKMEGIKTGYMELFIGNVGGSLGETSALLLILGGLYLLYRGIIDWRIPAFYLGTVAVMTMVLGGDPIFHLFSGGLMLGAFFMATDMVTTPVTKMGKIIFGVGAGILVVIIRLYGGYPEGVLFSILLMNTFTPIIEKYTRPKIYGEVKR
ncbi:MAG: RnfABCDGE type electron transport complex subunit D [Firmicutes bacterium]|nr:RnfABCDGE type electron transport complex subunit D [Bacillota bacterium]MDD3298706.1 RnfABCDGE type electron transport complex subunit D [Bacillota bacterium]MDD3851342.1 RnfABCDGE type electron transport complex subunit D [Bacillota bacterium]MDD4706930.1 RnfABCDGE type electron transport complex subunit D [Bacillota bacterium]